LVHGWTTGIHKLTRFITTWTQGETTTFPLIVFSMFGHGGCTQMSFCPKSLEFSKLKLLSLWRPITSSADLQLRWSIKQSCSPHWKNFNNMWHTICTQINQGDSRLLMLGSQIGTLIPDPSFNHNLCYKYPNGSSKPISDI
jgi:hypothetical protein